MTDDTGPKLIIPAEAHTDDERVKVEFDAIHWFQGASAHDIARLVLCGWGGDYPADEVAQLCANHNDGLKRLFDYLAIVNQPRSGVCGFECHVNPDAAMAWLQAREKRKPPINRDAKLTYRHTLKDNSEDTGTAEVVIEADASWIQIAVWKQGEHLADVTVELYEGMIVARTWKTEDINGDPTTRTDLCRNPNLKPEDENEA